MRTFLPLLMMLALTVGAMMQSHEPASSVWATGKGDHAHFATTKMKCCEKAVVGDLDSNCAVDCHYLPALVAPPISPALASVAIPPLSDSVRDITYIHIRPPISI